MRLVIQLVANMTNLAWRPEWQSLLANGTVNNPAANNLTGIVYGASPPPFSLLSSFLLPPHLLLTHLTRPHLIRTLTPTRPPHSPTTPAGDYYFIKTTNDLVSLNITTCNGSLTGLTPSSPSSTLSPPNSSSSSSNSTSASGSGSTDGVRTSGALWRREVSGVGMAVVVGVVAAAMGFDL